MEVNSRGKAWHENHSLTKKNIISYPTIYIGCSLLCYKKSGDGSGFFVIGKSGPVLNLQKYVCGVFDDVEYPKAKRYKVWIFKGCIFKSACKATGANKKKSAEKK